MSFKVIKLMVHILMIRMILSRILTPCQLMREMYEVGIPKDELGTWSCIAHYESKYNTSAIGRLNGNWSNDFGIFQMSDRYWCKSLPKRSSANLCQMHCQQLLTENLKDAIKCAQIAKQLQGWKAWAAYNGICRRRKFHSKTIEECFE